MEQFHYNMGFYNCRLPSSHVGRCCFGIVVSEQCTTTDGELNCLCHLHIITASSSPKQTEPSCGPREYHFSKQICQNQWVSSIKDRKQHTNVVPDSEHGLLLDACTNKFHVRWKTTAHQSFKGAFNKQLDWVPKEDTPQNLENLWSNTQ